MWKVVGRRIKEEEEEEIEVAVVDASKECRLAEWGASNCSTKGSLIWKGSSAKACGFEQKLKILGFIVVFTMQMKRDMFFIFPKMSCFVLFCSPSPEAIYS